MTHRRKRSSVSQRTTRPPGDSEIAGRIPRLDSPEAGVEPIEVNVLESMVDGFMALSPDWLITYVNAAAERTNRMPRESLLGKAFWEAFPTVAGTDFERGLRKSMAQRVPVRSEAFHEPYGRWFEMDI